MTKAFVFVNVAQGAEKKALTELRAMPEVKESYPVYGLFDIVAVLETNSMDQLMDAVSRKVRSVDSVKSTVTSIVP